MKATPVIKRQAARVLLFDDQERLLLLFDPDPVDGSYWYPPGGRIEAGESPEQAARRELIEEVGIDAVDIGPVVLRRHARFTYHGQRLDQDEWHLLGHLRGPAVLRSRPGDNEAAAVAAHRWWSLPELRASGERFFPEGLADLVESLLVPSEAVAQDPDAVPVG
jgi:8-oxo-dGTP pyrophosphatase MutT (NUDIX family)